MLARRGDALVQIGSVGGLGIGEQVYAVRYAGDRGYVVTFQQVDPLHVVDLSDPTKPVLRGTLSMPGYSSLLLPLSGDRLLGIGRSMPTRAATGVICPPNASCPSFGEPGGLQLALFDVSDPAHPKLLDRQVLSDTYATAVNDPHAVTLSPDGNLVILPSTSGPLAITISATSLARRPARSRRPTASRTSARSSRVTNSSSWLTAGSRYARCPALKQTGWIAF